MSSSASYHLVGESSTDPDLTIDHQDNDSLQPRSEMGYRLGVFRACYVVALCSIGSFLFAYVSQPIVLYCHD